MVEPLNADGDGRNLDGTFAKGNSISKGNPYSKRVGQLRSTMIDAVTDADMQVVIAAIVQQARDGDLAAAKLLFDRTLGPPIAADIMAKIEELDERIEAIQD